MKKALFLLCFLPVLCSQLLAQNCAQPAFPANNAQMVELIYDQSTSSINQKGEFNGVRVRWRPIPGASFYIVHMNPSFEDGSESWSAVYPGPVFDTTTILPVQYGKTYKWYVTDVFGSAQPCSNDAVYSFTTVPPPANCKPACSGGGFWSWDQAMFTFKLKSEQNAVDLFLGPCYTNVDNKSSMPSFIPGNTYPAVYQDLGGSSAYSYLWIDFNDNGYFETNEIINKVVGAWSNGPMPADNSFYIPQSATPGTHRMRIVSLKTTPCDLGNQTAADMYVNILSQQTKRYILAELSQKNTCVTVTNSSLAYFTNEWRQLVDANGRVVAAINPQGNNLGDVTVAVYQNAGAIRTLPNGKKVLDRSIEIKVENQPQTPVDVRLYFSLAEFNALKAADNSVIDVSSINISKFSSGCGETPGAYNFIGQSSSGQTGGYYYVQFSTTSFSNFYIRGGVDPGLPVEFLSANAKREAANTIINWQTATEQNNKGFDIEYSTDGALFRNLGFVSTKANAGNSNATIAYRFVHEASPVSAGFYRIKQIDKNGAYKYSPVLSVNEVSGKFSIGKVYPNPVRDRIFLQLNASAGQGLQLQLSTLAGVVLKDAKQTVAIGENKMEIALDNIPAGLYLLTVKDEHGNKLEQLKVSKL